MAAVPIYVLPGTNDVDWSTFETTEVSSATAPAGSFVAMPLAGLPYGTNTSPDLAGPGATFGPSGVQLTGAGPYAGVTFFIRSVSDGAGNLVFAAYTNPWPFPGGPSVIFAAVVRFRFRVSDVNGLESNTGTFYYQLGN